MEVTGKIVKLRAIEEQDMSFLQKMINSSGIEAMTTGSWFPVSYEKQMDWFRSRNEQEDLRYMIQIINGQTIGLISVTDIDWKNRTADMGIKIGNIENRKENDVYEAVMLTLRYCFLEMNLHVITSKLLAYNHLSKKLNMKCGFVQEGRLRERVFKKGNYQDLLLFSILRDDFEKAFALYENITERREG